MALRTITDEGGRQWQVWETRPSGDRVAVADRFVAGWLSFEALTAGGEKRRLAPIPDGWAELSDERLRDLLHRAAVVPAARRTPRA